ncbi:Oidioi.mRNA.OKI2018_I69.chr2.g8379.t1.cds [Oikopleura dioica]|uniref:Oidioi.mRNA.OKI2018_I69.chr2.g8379.t1.cds n=1 Tax=Oikopleura dioica TaxID=34765 RepID=A0ABN7TF96_OIKDI|nr:Oidioi.mRNA.OKI2018_I69.chr2.g8379.t1.cds [Oikopleura dioica]
MAKIVDLTKTMIEIFNEHAGDDEMLSKEELLKMMGQEKDDMFSSKYISNALMTVLVEGLDEKMSFNEFIEFMAFICALIEAEPQDHSDGPWIESRTKPEPGTPEYEEMKLQEALEKIKKFIAKHFGPKKKKDFYETNFGKFVDSIANAGF